MYIKSEFKRILAICLALIMMAFSFTACAGNEEAEDPEQGGEVVTIRIGNTQPLSGPSASAGTNSKAAAELALDIINNDYPDIDLPFAAGEGLPDKGGAKIEIVWGDNKSTAQDAMTEAERIINSGVVLMTGGNFSGMAAAASEVSERMGIPYVNDCASSPALNGRGYQWYFSNTPDDKDFAYMFFDFMKDMKAAGHKIDTIGLIYMNSAFGMDGATAVKEIAAEQGYEIVTDLMYDVKTTNVSGEIQKLKAADPDIVIPISNVTDATLIMKTMKDMGYVPPIILAQNSGFVEREFPKMLGEDSYFILSRDLFTPALGAGNPSVQKVADLFYERNGFQMNGQSARTFQTILLIADVLNRAESLEPEDIRTAIKETNITSEDMFMPWKGIKFGDNGKNVLGRGIIVQIQDGEYVPVWPADVATKDIILPFPAWDQRQ